MTKLSSLNGRLAKWVMLLSQYEIQFLPQKAVKGQTVAYFLDEHPDSRTTKLYEDLSDQVAKVCMSQTPFKGQVWQLFFDGASRTGSRGNIIAGVGIVLVSPQNYVIPRAFSLIEPYSNNVANALLIGMQIADEIDVKNLKAYSDSKLIVNQVRGEYEVRHKDLVPCHNAIIHMAEKFRNFYIDHVPRRQNAHADALASLVASLALSSRSEGESTHLQR